MPNWDLDCDDETVDLRGAIHMPITKKRKSNALQFRPTLIVVGESMVDPKDVAAIKKVRSKTDLYVIVLKSQPNMEFPFWANGQEVAKLLEHFNIVE